MPHDDPDAGDPLELCGVGVPDPGGLGMTLLAECFAEEFLRLGHSAGEVLALFRSPEYRLAYQAWCALGDERVSGIVATQALVWCRPCAPSVQGA